MHARKLFSLATAGLAISLLSFTASCGDDDPTEPTDLLVGTWNATSFSALGQDFIANGMDVSLAFTSSGNYTLTFTNDMIGSCDPGPNCTQTGNYTATSTQVTFDPGTADATTLAYVIQSNVLTLTGEIDGNPVVITADRD